jgi:hypothetical protein
LYASELPLEWIDPTALLSQFALHQYGYANNRRYSRGATQLEQERELTDLMAQGILLRGFMEWLDAEINQTVLKGDGQWLLRAFASVLAERAAAIG